MHRQIKCLFVWGVFVLLVRTIIAKSYVVYSNGATSERNLPLCGGPREACNIIHRRYWLSPLILRHCKCPDRTDCPAEWTNNQDKNTIMFNSRAQLKFCSRVGELKECEGKNALAAEVYVNGSTIINCFCGAGNFYRKLYEDKSGKYYACIKYHTCKNEDFCGHITVNSYETYHICSCPSNHICILKDRNINPVKEFLYEGDAFSGYCISKDNRS